MTDPFIAYALDEEVIEADPEFADAYARMVAAAQRVLSPKVCHLIGIAVNAAGTHLNREAVEAHVRAAMEHGATDEEILATLQFQCALATHAVGYGMPIVREESEELARKASAELTPEQEELKEYYAGGRGPFSAAMHNVLVTDPEFFRAIADLINHPWRKNALEPKVRELIYISIDSSITHMHPGTRRHTQAALEAGATPAEILAALELSCLVGAQGYPWGVKALSKREAAVGVS
jgi:alkylhydroperoxidase/carboxymuconolactone decarboxylase family protein YurZ